MVTFGEQSWDDEAPKSGSSDFFNMKEDKQYLLRVVGRPYTFATHWVDGPGGKKKKVNCAQRGCILCAKGLKASQRYFLPVIVRDENRVAVTEFGPQVYSGIQALYKQSVWGPPTGYDISIDKNTNRDVSKIYFVVPNPKTPVSDQEKTMVKEFMDRVDLVELSSPLTNEIIVEKLGAEFCRHLGLSMPQSAGASAQSGSSEFDSFGADDTEFKFD